MRPSAADAIPPLENGDHLSRPEFERRFEATPGLKKAELIEGIVYMPPPVSTDSHGRPHFDLITVLGTFRAATPGLEGGDNSSVRLDLDNMPQPDVCLFLTPAAGGQSKIDADGYLNGAPEFVAEIAASTASYDLHEKLRVYRRNGVREYVVWRTFDGAVDYFVWKDAEYQRLAPTDAVYRSQTLPGLWLDFAALLAGDLAAALRKMQEGIASPEHAAFVAKLQAAQQPPKTT